MSFVAQGLLPIESGFGLVLGANLGAAINPLLEIPRANIAAKRVLLGNFINRAFGVWAALTLFPFLAPAMAHIEADARRSIADFHAAFNVALALAFFPWLSVYSKLLTRLAPDRTAPTDPATPLYLSPDRDGAAALGGAIREALRMADFLESMLRSARIAFEADNQDEIANVRRTDDVLDKLNRAIKNHLSLIDSETVTEADQRRISRTLAFTTQIEQAGDAVDKGLLVVASKSAKRNLTFPNESRVQIVRALDRLIENVRDCAVVFVSGDDQGARHLVGEKEAFRLIESVATEAHFEKLRAGDREAIETSALYLDALRDLKWINAHLIEAAAYPLLKESGELLPSRLKLASDNNVR